MSVLRHPLLPVGVLLVLLGFGNWYTGRDKTSEYEHLLASGSLPPPVENVEDFHELNERTSATLLSRLQRGSDEHTFVNAKLDFYKVVRSGGRLFMLCGLFCAAAALIRTWYWRRLADREGLAPQDLK
jgi:hypothetical protein